ncbi:hypothetical protein RIF29_27569 [Crotalaria pallida]|uniref:AT-hook motif nuclear-localized protein n=1 Tax=Crotalaria pallida TaxID=3830 RepID=A0AAN9EQ00_CROPI
MVVVCVYGLDVVGRILAFSRNVVRATVCILSVTGVVSSVLIRKSDSSNDETLRREGCYAILSLSGSYTYVDGDIKGMSNILLAEPDGKVFGGAVEGSLIAAAPIQLIVASFKQTMTMSKKIKRNHSAGSSAAVTTTIDKDLNRVPLKAPETIRDSNPSFSSPTSGLMPTITNRVSENVIPANQKTQTATMNGVGLDSHTLQQPITDSTQNIVADDNVVV